MDEINSKPISAYLKIHAPMDGGFSTVILGSSRSGKTTLLVELLTGLLVELYTRYIPLILTESPNAEPLAALDVKSFPICRKGFDLLLVKEMVRVGTLYKEKCRPVICIDDCNTRQLRSRVVEDLVLLRRNEYVTTLLATHYVKLITPAVRDSANFIILMKINSFAGQDAISRMFIGPLLQTADRKLCRDFYVHVTLENKGCILQDCLNGRVFVVQNGSLFEILPYFNAWKNNKARGTSAAIPSNHYITSEEEEEEDDEFVYKPAVHWSGDSSTYSRRGKEESLGRSARCTGKYRPKGTYFQSRDESDSYENPYTRSWCQ